MEQHEKICPACAENVKAAAKVCKHCGLIFEENHIVSNSKTNNRTRQRTATIFLIASFGLIILFALSISGNSQSYKKSRYDGMTKAQRAAEDYRAKTGLYPDQEAEIVKHCQSVPKPWDC